MGTMAQLRSIGVRILVPVLLATLGVVALGWVQIDSALTTATQAARSERLAAVPGTIVTLVHELGQEYVDTNEADRRGEAGRALLAAQQVHTDAAATAYTVAMGQTRATLAAVGAPAPGLGRLVDAADGALARLASTRQQAQASANFEVEVSDAFATMRRVVIAVAEAIPAELTPTAVIEDARAVALLVLAGLAGREHDQRDALQALPGSPATRLSDLTDGPEAATAAQLRDAVLASGGETGSLAAALRVNPDRSYGAQGEVLNRLRLLETELTTDLERDVHRVSLAARDRIFFAAGLTALIAGATLAAVVIFAVRTNRRLRRLRQAALTAARTELPAAITELIAAGDADAVHAALTDSCDRIDAMLVQDTDEIGELGTAFGTVHRQALRLAADQALLRMEVEAMFVALSRRGQTLVQRQIHLIDEFGRLETDPEALDRLFALDHLAARMRRNEENLLVLAGGEPARWVTGAVAAIDVIRAAAQEIEQYQRIAVATTPPIAVAAFAAGNVIHLLAELLENATSFSAPATPVRVVARRGVDGLTITVYDEGIGMPDDRVVEANQRLAQPSALTSVLVGTMGLLVVARLAQRHQIRVRLTSSPGSGTAATVLLPDHILDPLPVADQLHTGRWLNQPVTGRGTAPAAAVPPPEPALRSLPSPADVSAATAVRTAAGLPRRGPGATAPDEAAGDGRPPGPPDPETARARLSSLAKGLAAANRQPSAPDQQRQDHQ